MTIGITTFSDVAPSSALVARGIAQIGSFTSLDVKIVYTSRCVRVYSLRGGSANIPCIVPGNANIPCNIPC